MRLLFVTIANKALGYGHLNRCLSIARYARADEANVEFLLFGDAFGQARVEASGFPCQTRSVDDLGEADATMGISRADAVVSDLIHSTFFVQRQVAPVILGNLRQLGDVVVAIDSLGEQSLTAQLPTADIDLLVVPYVGPEVNEARVGRQVVRGAAYAMLSPEYANLPSRKTRALANRILVSCGGSDARGSTKTVLQGLDKIPERLEVKVVIGPFFSNALRTEIERLIAASKHKMQWVFAPDSLLEDMLWCDIAIAASGLTKYELAASGTPALLFSMDIAHHEVNKPFAAIGTVIDLGVDMSPASVCGETGRLLADHVKRQSMSATGKKIVDGLGAQRLITEIRKEWTC